MFAVREAHVVAKVKAGSGRDELLGMRDGKLLARVAAPPLQGRANRALCRLIARRLGVASSAVTIARGARSSEKLVRIAGIEPGAAQELLGSTD